jgi:hypothetical protein
VRLHDKFLVKKHRQFLGGNNVFVAIARSDVRFWCVPEAR